MHDVAYAPESEAQLVALYFHIAAAASPEIAANDTDAIVQQCETLKTFPKRSARGGGDITSWPTRLWFSKARFSRLRNNRHCGDDSRHRLRRAEVRIRFERMAPRRQTTSLRQRESPGNSSSPGPSQENKPYAPPAFGLQSNTARLGWARRREALRKHPQRPR